MYKLKRSIVHCDFVVCVPGDWSQTTYSLPPHFIIVNSFLFSNFRIDHARQRTSERARVRREKQPLQRSRAASV